MGNCTKPTMCCVTFCPKCCHQYGCACCKRVPGTHSLDLEELYDVAQTGDIILYNKKGIACFQKCFARSPWVHIGVVVELGVLAAVKGKYLLDTTTPFGVSLTPLRRSLRYWLQHPEKLGQMVYRPMIADRTAEKMLLVETVALGMQGKPYESNYGEIVSAIISQDNLCLCCSADQQSEEEAREEHLHALFCSELVACVFQQAGWMSEEYEANRFLPKVGHVCFLCFLMSMFVVGFW